MEAHAICQCVLLICAFLYQNHPAKVSVSNPLQKGLIYSHATVWGLDSMSPNLSASSSIGNITCHFRIMKVRLVCLALLFVAFKVCLRYYNLRKLLFLSHSQALA